MSYQTELDRIVAAKAAMRESIIAKGVEVPEDAKLVSYPEYITQIGPAPEPSGDGSLTDLKLALSTSNPAQYYPIGTELPDTYDGKSNPLIVAQYLNDSNNTDYGGAEGVILVRKYVDPRNTAWGTDANETYTNSAFKSYLDTTYLEKSSEELQSVISEITIHAGGATIPNNKWFAMSAIEVGGTIGEAGDGFFWDYWKQVTGLSSPSDAGNAPRVGYNQTEGASNTGLRTISGAFNRFINTVGQITLGSITGNFGQRPACFISKN